MSHSTEEPFEMNNITSYTHYNISISGGNIPYTHLKAVILFYSAAGDFENQRIGLV